MGAGWRQEIGASVIVSTRKINSLISFKKKAIVKTHYRKQWFQLLAQSSSSRLPRARTSWSAAGPGERGALPHSSSR